MKIKTNINIYFILLLSVVVKPALADYYSAAEAIVPCGARGDLCTLCHFALMGQNIFVFLLKISFVVALLNIIIIGILHIVSAGGKVAQAALHAFGLVLAGFGIVLLAWLGITFIAKALGFTPEGGSWSSFTVECSDFGKADDDPPNPSPNPDSGLTVSPSPIVFNKEGQTQQLSVTYNEKQPSYERLLVNQANAAGKDVTAEATYSSNDLTIASVSKEGLVKNEYKFGNGGAIKETSIAVSYKGETARVNTLIDLPVCPLAVAPKRTTGSPLPFSLPGILAANAANDFTGPDPNEAVLTAIRSASGLHLKVCFSPDFLGRIGQSERDNLSLTIKNTTIGSFDSDNTVKSSETTYIFHMPYSDTMKEGKYDVIINAGGNKNAAEKPQSFTITDSDCIPVNPAGMDPNNLKTDKRIAIVFVPHHDFQNELELYRSEVDKFAEINVSPVTTKNFTVWRSDKVDELTCLRYGNSDRMIMVLMIRSNASAAEDCEGDTLGFAVPENISMGICAENFLSDDSIHRPEILTHETAHIIPSPILTDEYVIEENMAPQDLSSPNCAKTSASSTGNERVAAACTFYKNIDPGFDCTNIWTGCNLISGKDQHDNVWYRSIEKGIMGAHSYGASTFGPIDEKLFYNTLRDKYGL